MPDLLRSRSLDTIGKSLVVGLAQLVERQIVVLEVVGSNPTSHPTPPSNPQYAAGVMRVSAGRIQRISTRNICFPQERAVTRHDGGMDVTSYLFSDKDNFPITEST